MISFIQMSLSAAVLAAVVLFMRGALGGRLPRKTFKLLWAVVILRMLVPISLPLMKINIGAAAPVPAGAALSQDTVVYSYIDGEFTRAGMGLADFAEGTVCEVSETGKLGVSLAAVWSIGAIAVFGYFAVSHILFRKRAGEAIPLENPKILGIAEKYSLKRKVRIKVSDRLSSPLTYGVLRPVIILPKDVLRGGGKSAEYILAHEFTHIKRFDALYKWVMTAAVCLHWFNPLAWVMFAMAGRDIELSCDEEVILAAGGAREEYALTLIGMEERRSFGVLQSGFGGNSVTERIRAAMTVKKATPAGKAAAAILAVSAGLVFTVYDIEPDVSAAVTVSAVSADSYDTNYEDWVVEDAAAVEDTPYYIETYVIGDIAVSAADIYAVAADTYHAAETSDYAIQIADEDEEYTIFSYCYYDCDVGDFVVTTLDLNEYSPIDCAEYGLEISPTKGCYLYNDTPVAGLQLGECTFVDDNAIRDDGVFLIYDEGEFTEVNTAQFYHITGLH